MTTAHDPPPPSADPAERPPPSGRRYRLTILCSHAIQYFMPWFRALAAEPRLSLRILLGDEHGLRGASFDPGFGRPIQWDSPLTEGLPVQLLKNRSPRPGVGRFLGIVNPELFSCISRDSCDALLIHGWNYALYPMALLAARARGVPVLLRAESPLLPGDEQAPVLPLGARLRSTAKHAVLRRYLGACAGALAVSSGNRRLLLRYGVPPERIFFTPYTVDSERFTLPPAQHQAARARLRGALGLANDTPLILSVGKLQPVKQPLLLLQAYAALRRAGTTAALAFVGDGELREALQAQARDVPDVHFLGFKNQSELPEIYPAADVFVLPSRSETFGLVLIEAMLAGLPVVASDGVGCAEDLVRPDTGRLFPRADQGALTRALAELCRDPAERARLGQGSRALVSRWTFTEATRGLLQALDAVVGDAGASR